MSFGVCLTRGYQFIWDRPDLNFVNAALSFEFEIQIFLQLQKNTEKPFNF